MPRQKKKIWKCYNEKSDGSVECNYCKQTYKFGNVSKMETHIKKCLKCPEQMRRTIFEEEPSTSFSYRSIEKQFLSESEESIPSLSQFPTPSRSQTSTPVPLKRSRLLDSFVDSISPEENVISIITIFGVFFTWIIIFCFYNTIYRKKQPRPLHAQYSLVELRWILYNIHSGLNFLKRLDHRLLLQHDEHFHQPFWIKNMTKSNCRLNQP